MSIESWKCMLAFVLLLAVQDFALFWSKTSLRPHARFDVAAGAGLSHFVSWLADSWLYHGKLPASAPTSSLAWLPAAGDFLVGLQQLGWEADGVPRSSNSNPLGVQPKLAMPADTPITAAFSSPLKGPKLDRPRPQLHSLQLLWRFLAAVCRQVIRSSLQFSQLC